MELASFKKYCIHFTGVFIGAFEEDESRVFQIPCYFGQKSGGVNPVRNPVIKSE